ncbi:MAG TPA: SDR family oxidoreductase [Acetobacteraceae bacterium]|nr:SDR family oxidoreductase [Acetobacteraceae bacterium]
MNSIVVVTGATAGVGRATAREFARRGCRLGLMARGQDQLDATAAELRDMGAEVCAVSVDMADADAVERAAERVEQALGPIDIWVNNAMATVFAPVRETSPAEFRRATEATYLGAVNGTMAALKRMAARNRGTIVQVGSALSYRAIPLQAAYCGAKYAIRGFTDSLRCELIHDRLKVHLTMVHLPAVNTPQFDWARNHMTKRAQPVPPIFQPEVPARAIAFAATHRRREIWLGWPTVKAILANKVAPGLLDRYLARKGYDTQLGPEPHDPSEPGNLFEPLPGDPGAHGRFDAQSRDTSSELFTSRHRDAFAGGLLMLGALALGAMVRRGVARRC